MGTCTCGKKPEEHLDKNVLTQHHYWYMHNGLVDGCAICEMSCPTKRAADSLKAGASCLPDVVKVENALPAESG